MGGEWPLVTVGELADSISDKHKLGKDHLIFLNTSDVLLGKILHHSYSTVSDWPGQAKKSIQRNDILFSEIRPANGRWAYVDIDADDYVVSTKLMVIRARERRVVPRFLYHFLTNAETTRWLQHLAESRSGTFPQITFDQVAELELVLPPLGVQANITNFLDCISNKIELNHRMNETLEAMARMLFKSWFVDFDPVRSKKEGRDTGLPKHIADLFPATFQDSPIGPIPKDWNVEPFDAHITAERGLSYKGEGLRDDGTGLPMHNLNSIYEGGGYKHEGIKYYDGEYREKHLLRPGDMIVTNTEQGFDHLLIGHAAIVPACYGPKGLYSHHIYRVRMRPSSPFSPHYLVELFNNRLWHYWISGFSNGTTINMLPLDALEMPLLVVPSIGLVRKFNELAEAAHLQIEANIQQSRTLAALRDTLLPKLISGELRVGVRKKTGGHRRTRTEG